MPANRLIVFNQVQTDCNCCRECGGAGPQNILHRKRFISNTVFLLASGFVASVIGLIVLPVFISELGEGMYGLFVIANMLNGYVGLLDFGFTDGLTRHIGRAYADRKTEELCDSVWTGFWLLSAVGVLAGILIFAGRYAILDVLHVEGTDRLIASRLLTVVAVYSLLQWPMRLPAAILQGVLRIKELGMIQASQKVTISLVMLVMLFLSFDIVGIQLGVCVVSVAFWLPLILLVRRFVPELSWQPLRFRWRTLRCMLRFSVGMFYSKLLSLLSIRIDHLIIGAMIGVSAIAPYAVAAKLFGLISAYGQKLFGAFLPTVYSLDTAADRPKLQTLLDASIRYRALLVTPLAYVGIVLSPAFIRTWMGADYVQYAIWSQLFVSATLLNVFGTGLTIARGLGRLALCNGVATLRVGVNVLLSIALIRPFGVGGPILGTVISGVLLGDGVLLPVYCTVSGLSWRKALFDGFRIILTNLPLALVACWLVELLCISTWLPLCLMAGLLCAVFYGVLFVCFVTNEERRDFRIAVESLGILPSVLGRNSAR